MLLPAHPTHLLALALLILTPLSTAASKARDAVLLSSIKTLTLRANSLTTARRVSPIPQLKCTGGSAKGLYDVDTMRCTNSGSSYNSADVEWTCKASLPPEFKLGSTDVICEGYSSPDDDYILKGSCGVEYRLILTEEGEARYGKRHGGGGLFGDGDSHAGPGNDAVAYAFWAIFIGVALWMLYSAFIRPRLQGQAPPPRAPPRGGFFGGGGGNDDDDNNDPPPPYTPYSPRPSSQKKQTYGTTPTPAQAPSGQAQSGGQQGQGQGRGFWQGAAAGTAAGAAAGWFAGRRGQQNAQQEQRQVPRGWGWGAQAPEDRWQYGGGGGAPAWGAGPSRSMGRTTSSSSSSSGSGPSYSNTRYESTGFGSTSRR